MTAGKPPYRVPSMAEIAAIPWNGFTAISTFSGCGGSSLGYRIAGFRVAWASEFVQAARDTYLANCGGSTVLDPRDIRGVAAADILSATGLSVGELDLFDGSPPCASFSVSGKLDGGWGTVKSYSDTRQRTDDLFFEYARLLADLQPKTFVAENVSGLVKGRAKGYFKEIISRLKSCGYQVEARVLNAAWLGVPQGRQRLIFVGVRDDIGIPPAFPVPLRYSYTVHDALSTLPELDSHGFSDPETGADIDIRPYAIGRVWKTVRPGQKPDKYVNLYRVNPNAPCNTITQKGGDVTAAGITHWAEPRKFNLRELRRIGGFPDDFVLTGTYEQRWERIGRAVPPVMMGHIAAAIRDRILIPARDRKVTA